MNLQLDEKRVKKFVKNGMYKTCSNVGKKGRRKLLEFDTLMQQQLTTAGINS